MKHTLKFLTALLLAPQASLHAADLPALSAMVQPAKRSPAAPRYEDICFSPRFFEWPRAAGRDVIKDAQAFHATRLEWQYLQEGDEPIVQQLRGLGVEFGLALTHPLDTTARVTGAMGFAARPDLYTRGRILDIDGKVIDGRGSMHDPAFAEVTKLWLRFFASFRPKAIQRDEPGWDYANWDFNPYALSQFNDYLATRVSPETRQRLAVSEPARFDLKAYIRGHQDGKSVPADFKKLWEEFRLETLLAWYRNLRTWTVDLVGPEVAWSCNYSSFVQFTPTELWSDYAITELQPSGGQFGLGNPWSLYRKVQIARQLGKAIVATLGSQDIRENKVMIGLTYAMGTHMLCPYGVYMKDRPRKYDDPALYADVYDFVHRWAGNYLAGYEEAFALGNGIDHPLTRDGLAPIRLEDPTDSVYAFVRARPALPDAPVVIHLVNWNKTARPRLALTLEPDRFFPGRGLKLSLLRPGSAPEILSDGWQARIELPSPDPWALLVVEPASPTTAKVWAAEIETENLFGFLDQQGVVLRSRTPEAAIHFTTDGSEPTANSPRYAGPLEFTQSTTLRTRVFAGGQSSAIAMFTFTKRPANSLVTARAATPGLLYDVYQGTLTSAQPDLDDPMKWAGGDYQFRKVKEGRTDRIVLPSGFPTSTSGVVFTGFIEIPRDGLYTLYANADDECTLYIDDEKVIDQTGRKAPPDLGMTELQGRRLLSKGLHKLRIEYVQMYHGYGLDVQWQGPGLPRQAIAPGYLVASVTSLLLTVAPDGSVRLDNRPFSGMGVNYFDAFGRVLWNAADKSYEEGFRKLGEWSLPFARLDLSGYQPIYANLFFADRAEYFRRLDAVVASAERNGVGLIPSFFWTTFTFSDLAGERLDQIAVTTSLTRQKMREFVTAIVQRYRTSRAIWAWEFGNEWNLMVDLPNATQFLPPTWTNLGNPATRDPVRDLLTTDIILPALREFATLVRDLDPGRPISSGHAIPRNAAWHMDQWQRGLLPIDQAWTADTYEQAKEIALRQCPAPFDLFSIHVYGADAARVPAYARIAAEAGRALFVGEFGAETEAEFRSLLAACRAAPLAAVWAYDRVGEAANDPMNTTTTNSRSWMLRALLPNNGKLVNLSVRTTAGTAAQTLIVGFVVAGAPDQPLLLRGIGPGLASFGVTGFLADPSLQLFAGPTLLATNDNWSAPVTGTAASVAAAFAAVGAFFLPATSLDAALVRTLGAGSYSVQIGGASATSGVALAEIYDRSSAASGRLANLSARAEVGAGTLIVGFTIAGQAPLPVLVRAIGPTLGTSFGVAGALANPHLELFRGATLAESNDDWGGSAALAAAYARLGAFALPADSRDAALLVTLAPGSYTAQTTGVGGTPGIALVEVYDLP